MASTINASTAGVGGVITTADNTGILNIQSGGTTVAAVTSTGVAVTGALSASGLITKTNPAATNTQFFAVSGGTTAYTYGQITNTGANLNWGIDSSTGGGLLTGSSAYSSSIYTGTSTPLHFGTNNTLRMTLDASGVFKVNRTTNSSQAADAIMQVLMSNPNSTAAFENTNATAPYGIGIYYSGGAPNNTGSQFFNCGDTSATRVVFRSNGGLANFSANNVNLSDARVKKDIVDAGNYLDKICAIPVRTFLYKDQTDDELNLGVIAQEVEAVAPELVDLSGFGETPEDGVPLKAIYQTDLQYALMKSIQELKAEIDLLKGVK